LIASLRGILTERKDDGCVVEAAGVRDILSKSLRSANPFNVVYATLAGLEDLETREESYRRRGKELPVRSAAPAVAA
jgi:ribosomal protein S5